MEPDSGIPALIRAQGADGGWGYHPNSSSWTEPTALAVIALSETPEAHHAAARGREWLAHMQRSDGGWPPCSTVDQSTWVTSFASIALADWWPAVRLERAITWLVNQSGRGLSRLETLRSWLLREKVDLTPSGWSWYPGTASWVIPTAVTLLALKKIAGDPASRARERIEHGKDFLLARECAGGGWNHGGTFVRSENSPPYPETTGLALLALRDADRGRVAVSLARASEMLQSPQSAQGSACIRMGLAAHGTEAPGELTALPSIRTRHWTTVDLALHAIAAMYRNPLLS